MSIVKITQYKDPILYKKTCDVMDVKDPKILKVVTDLKDTILRISDAIGLAAPQIGYNLSIFAILRPEYVENFPEDKSKLNYKDVMIFINPVITSYSPKKNIMEEGCLSLPNEFYSIKRSYKITIKALDENGKKIKIRAKGMLARVIQHEIDHLSQKLIIDRAR